MIPLALFSLERPGILIKVEEVQFLIRGAMDFLIDLLMMVIRKAVLVADCREGVSTASGSSEIHHFERQKIALHQPSTRRHVLLAPLRYPSFRRSVRCPRCARRGGLRFPALDFPLSPRRSACRPVRFFRAPLCWHLCRTAQQTHRWYC